MSQLESDYAILPIREYQHGEVVIEEGGRSGALYFLKQGKVTVHRDEVLLAEVSDEGAILGEVSILLDRPHMARVEALGTACFHVAEDPETFLIEHPNVNLEISRSLARKVDSMSCYLTDLKQQYAGESNHLGMVHEVLDSLMQSKKS